MEEDNPYSVLAMLKWKHKTSGSFLKQPPNNSTAQWKEAVQYLLKDYFNQLAQKPK